MNFIVHQNYYALIMLKPIDDWFLRQEEPSGTCLQFLREHIIARNTNISESWKYGMPFFCYKKKMFCYLWTHKKYRQPYLGIVDGNAITEPGLIQEKRARMKILLLDPEKDLPIAKINRILKEALINYK